jgi:hypothetical protein
MNYILLSILISLLVIGYIQFKKKKDTHIHMWEEEPFMIDRGKFETVYYHKCCYCSLVNPIEEETEEGRKLSNEIALKIAEGLSNNKIGKTKWDT